jgi:BirA family biotin operon repressor/biotin-[acetyl-CoA-carboxylase] ligase
MPDDNSVLPAEIKALLSTRVFGRRIYYIPEVDSTNRAAVELARSGEAHGTLVIADFQTKGRGRFNRSWLSDRGRNLMFSLILRPDIPFGAVLPVTLAFAVSIGQTLENFLETDVGVKWPNDVIVDGRKICGILSEGASEGDRTRFIVVGIGINVNVERHEFPEEIRRIACSCSSVAGRRFDRKDVLVRVLASLESAYDEFVRDGFEAMAARFKAKLTILDRQVTYTSRGVGSRGTVVDVGSDGGLVVKTDKGKRVVLYDEDVSVSS